MVKIRYFGFNSKNAAQHTEQWEETFAGSFHEIHMHAGNKAKEFAHEFPGWMLIYKVIWIKET